MGDRTVTAGIPIPNWMKSRLNDKYNLDDSAFSPPGEDDGFFSIPYSKLNKSSTDFTTLKDNTDETKFVSITKALHLDSTSANNNDYTKHTVPCQKYMGGMCDPAPTVNKSYGTDDGFKGEASQCGQSIVAVAEQMVRTNQFYNGRASDDTFNSNSGLPNDKYIRTRRNSRSLPTSPLSRRKNPFFTPPILAHVNYDGSADSLASSHEVPKYVAPAAARAAAKLRDASPSRGLRAKPTELREINFWSPTSM
uniref:Uncharacterized protein n=1 Tax=Cacopsylla melanoneura TaxID=428564 RepID=A0A8D8XYV3_9HEMI